MTKPYKKPKCHNCKDAMIYIFFREQHIRDHNIGFYCKNCKSVHINHGIKIIPGPVYVRLEELK